LSYQGVEEANLDSLPANCLKNSKGCGKVYKVQQGLIGVLVKLYQQHKVSLLVGMI